MNEKPCEKEKKEMDKAREDLDAAKLRSYPPPSFQPIDPNKDIEPIIISPENDERMMRAGENIPKLERIYLEKFEAYNNCKKANKKSKQ